MKRQYDVMRPGYYKGEVTTEMVEIKNAFISDKQKKSGEVKRKLQELEEARLLKQIEEGYLL